MEKESLKKSVSKGNRAFLAQISSKKKIYVDASCNIKGFPCSQPHNNIKTELKKTRSKKMKKKKSRGNVKEGGG